MLTGNRTAEKIAGRTGNRIASKTDRWIGNRIVSKTDRWIGNRIVGKTAAPIVAVAGDSHLPIHKRRSRHLPRSASFQKCPSPPVPLPYMYG